MVFHTSFHITRIWVILPKPGQRGLCPSEVCSALPVPLATSQELIFHKLPQVPSAAGVRTSALLPFVQLVPEDGE